MSSEDHSAVPRLFFVGSTPQAIRNACDTLPYPTQQFSHASEFFSFAEYDQVGCVIAQQKLPLPSSFPTSVPDHLANGIKFARELQTRNRSLQVLLVIEELATDAFRELYHSSIFDILTGTMDSESILQAIDAAAKKSLLVSYSMMENALLRDRVASLTQRESDVVKLLCHGKQLKEVSATLGVSVQTASKHRSRIFRKLRVANEVELFRFYSELLLAPERVEQDQAKPPNFLEHPKPRVEGGL